jgi:peptidoglycan pentaglycine glycine transferase (the first glycine)
MQIQATTVNDRDLWNATLAQLPTAHILQTWEWGEFKQSTTGWMPQRFAYMHKGGVVAMAQVLTRQVGPLKIMYVPKGPALDYGDPELRSAVAAELQRFARDKGAIFIKIDPDAAMGTGVPGEPDALELPVGHQIAMEWASQGWQYSREQVQFPNSVIIDLRPDEQALLAAMKQKTRYNIELAQRKGVTARLGGIDDLDLLYRLYAETAVREGFVIRPLDYYRKAWGDFIRAGLAQPIIAEYQGRALAHVIIFGFAKRAWYFYGASLDNGQPNLPTHLLQWESIRWARAQMMQVYDLWGAPTDFYDANDPMAGAFQFKQGFGGTVIRRIGAWDRPLRPRLYKLYTQVMPTALNVMRGFGRRRMARQAQPGNE